MEEGGPAFEHIPVLVEQTIAWLAPVLTNRTLIDCTVGGGGHAEALLSSVDGLHVVGIDRDDIALAAAARQLARFGERVRLRKADFADLAQILADLGDHEVAGVLYDLGVSSAQLDDPRRGFGYRADADLDMRMDRSARLTAEEVVNTYSETRLAEVLTDYGEERYARGIARAIVRRREKRRFRTTGELSEVARAAIPAAAKRGGPHPARRTFQALRIEVNQELESLQRSLPAALGGVVPGGRVVVISYHSLEDRIVKAAFNERARGCRCPPDFPVCTCGRKATLRLLTKKAIRPSEEEVLRNPRSRSARARAAQRLALAEEVA